MLRKARGGINGFCLEVVCLPRTHPNGLKAGWTPFHGNETYRGYLKSEKFEGLSSRATRKKVSQRKLWKMPRHSWPLPHIFGCGRETLNFIPMDKWNIQYQGQCEQSDYSKESSLSTWEDSECVSSSLYRQCCYFGTQQINLFWSQSSHFKADRLWDLSLSSQGLYSSSKIFPTVSYNGAAKIFPSPRPILMRWKIKIKDFIPFLDGV